MVIAALLGADEYGFSTAPLIAMGCIMMRVCHLNTRPVGVATQDPALRARFQGTPDHVVNYLMHVAEEARRLMAGLGVRTLEELVGACTELLDADGAIEHWKAQKVDLSMVLATPEVPAGVPRRRTRGPLPVLDDALDGKLVRRCEPALESREAVRLGPIPVRNINRTVGGILSGEIARRHGVVGLPEGTIEIALRLGRAVVRRFAGAGRELRLGGQTNDYVGKGLSGGIVSVGAPETALFRPEENMIVGNSVLYGATAGRLTSWDTRASASRFATAVRGPSSKASGTTAAST